MSHKLEDGITALTPILKFLNVCCRTRLSLLTTTSFIFALILSVPSPVGLHHVVLALHIIMGKIKTDI
jgi:phosphotransferase system  glucose/maltose/N-acetylglucosamine-specific IIC component